MDRDTTNFEPRREGVVLFTDEEARLAHIGITPKSLDGMLYEYLYNQLSPFPFGAVITGYRSIT